MKVPETNQKLIVSRHFGSVQSEEIETYLALGGYSGLKKAFSSGAEAAIRELESADLKDSANGESNIAAQLKLCRLQPEIEKYVICNAMDISAAVATTSTLVNNDPHSILEGLLICGSASGTSKAIILVDRGRGDMISLLSTALVQAKDLGLITMEISIVEMEHKLVCSEETAILRGLEGKPPMPALTPPFPLTNKYLGKPAIVFSAEALANVAAILQDGATWFHNFGIKGHAGTRLLSVSGCFKQEGIVEVPLAMSLTKIIDKICGGVQNGKELKLVQVGGPTGKCLPGDSPDLDLALDNPAISGTKLLSGCFVGYDQDTCVLDLVLKSMQYTLAESCGKCVLCREGTYQLFKILSDAACGKSKSGDLDLITEICEGMQGNSLCEIGKAAPNPVLSMLTHFSDEFAAHLKRKKCPALVCKSYITYHILPDQCDGCGKCANECPEEAIQGKIKMIHVIDNDYCIKCGTCFEICQFGAGAVVKAGSIKPITPKKPIPLGSWKRRPG